MIERSDYLSNERAVKERSLLKNVYMWMTAGLALTAVVSLWMVSNPQRIVYLFQSKLIWVFLIAEFILVFFLSARIMNMKPQTAVLSFTAYSILNGITLSGIFFLYTAVSIASTLFITAGTFAAMSLYAVTTKRDLSKMGSYLMMGLIGIIIASVVNIFLKSPALYWVVSYAGVLVFCGLTAYDTQNILRMSREYSGSIAEEDYIRFSIIGALKLYLDFINMFIFFLRIFGRRN
ncbi:MAG: Bax inhibitor-1/YccA family protein [Spirochaetaceae bacterium]|nr:Bax inhibitor-1/YccA family protein [Spirochaetaceae bacterium]